MTGSGYPTACIYQKNYTLKRINIIVYKLHLPKKRGKNINKPNLWYIKMIYHELAGFIPSIQGDLTLQNKGEKLDVLNNEKKDD